MSDYTAFLRQKALTARAVGFNAADLNPQLFPFQQDIVRWALRRGRAAIFADCGLGKTPMQLEWATRVAEQTGGSVLIFAPLAVAQQTQREGEKFGIPVTVCRTASDLRPGINVTNYERLHHFAPDDFNGLVLDECFAPDTPVDVFLHDGTVVKRCITALQVGNDIANASGRDRVVATHRRRIDRAVAVTVGGLRHVVSQHHPYFTQRGWVAAKNLAPTDWIMATRTAVRLVSQGDGAEIPGGLGSEILRDILLSEMAHASVKDSGSGACPCDSSETWSSESRMVSLQESHCDQRTGTDSPVESNGRPISAGESQCDSSPDEASPLRTGRQWEGIDHTAEDSAGFAPVWLARRVCDLARPETPRLSDLLQSRSCPSRSTAMYRGRRVQSSGAVTDRLGSEKGSNADFVRVDGIEILEPGHPELERWRQANGIVYFHDIEAARHPSFSVDGLLVHNSSILKGFDGVIRRQLTEFARSIFYRLACTATPAPNDLIELTNHAEFLDVLTGKEILALFFKQDGNTTHQWRLKRHARHDFWRWMASWAVALRKPSDLGYADGDFVLPELKVTHQRVATTGPCDTLFPLEAHGLSERLQARRDSLDDRVAAVATVVFSSWEDECRARITSERTITKINNESWPAKRHELLDVQKKNVRDAKNITVAGLPTIEIKSLNTATEPQRVATHASGNDMQPTVNIGSAADSPRATEIKRASEMAGCLPSSELMQRPTIECSRPKLVSAQFASDQVADDCLLTTATLRGSSEDCSVLNATSESGSLRTTQPSSDVQPTTSTREPWIIWCHLNSEQRELEKAFGDLAFSIYGSLTIEDKEQRINGWLNGERPVLISKVSICGFGLNLQQCHQMVFVGLSDSFEELYQAIRRCWRFGQGQVVDCVMVAADTEGAVVKNLKRKEHQADELMSHLVQHMQVHALGKTERQTMDYSREKVTGGQQRWTMYLGDSVEVIDEIATDSVGLAVFSPPFPGMYAYTNSPRDMGNVRDIDEMIRQFAFLVAPEKLLRVLMPGRSCCVHLTQAVAFKGTDGYIGLKDFRGRVIATMEAAGWVYYGEVCIDKDPQVKAIRTKDAGLLFKSLATDSARMHMALADYLLQFRKPGENPTPIRSGISERYHNEAGWITADEWIEWAAPVWYRKRPGIPGGIKETDVLNVAVARSVDDERHLCPLQLGVVERAVKLWSNPNEIVLDPFAGVGSTGVRALEVGRRFIGIELKDSYFRTALRYLQGATVKQDTLFSDAAPPA